MDGRLALSNQPATIRLSLGRETDEGTRCWATLAPSFFLTTSMKVYGPYTRKDGRQHVVLYKDGVRTTVSYPKYLLEKKLGRKLESNETCDHIDNNPSNNSLDNLQVLSRSDNIRKQAALTPKELGTFTCSVCNCSFTKPLNQVKHNRKQNKSGPYCSRSCAGKGGHPSNKGV